MMIASQRSSGHREGSSRIDDPPFEQLAEAMNVLSWILEPETFQTLYVSSAYERITGWSCESAYETPPSWQGFVKPEFLPALLEMLEGAGRGNAGEVEIVIERFDGELRWIRVRGFPIFDSGKRIVQLGGLAEDITDQKEATEKISLLANMLDLAQDAVIVRDYEGTRIQVWNKGAELLYQYNAAEAVGKSLFDLVKPLDFDWESARRSLLETGEWQGEVRVQRPDNSIISVSARSTLKRDALGKPESILHIARDVTEQRQMEQQLYRAQRVKTVGTLASGVAHDLTNILSPIILSAPLLASDLKPDVKQNVIDMITASAKRGADLVRQVLAFARGADGKQMVLSISHLLLELEGILAKTFPKLMSISLHRSPNLCPVLGNPTQLHQVFLNLCVNARDAMADSGALTITANNFSVDEGFASTVPEAKPGPYVLVRVSDTGAGIPQNIVGKIFEPFFTTKAPGEGTGIGLSTTLEIVKSHGGFITVESDVGHGTEFKVFLPASPDRVEATTPATTSDLPIHLLGNGELVLLADDEGAFLTIVGAMLQEAGYKVLLANDGTSALAKYMQHRGEVQLVVTDAAMPNLDGISLTRALRQIDPHLRIIGVSGQAASARVNELKSLNLSAFLSKPFDGPTLMAAIHRALHSKP